jgi:hypothetical protein
VKGKKHVVIDASEYAKPVECDLKSYENRLALIPKSPEQDNPNNV